MRNGVREKPVMVKDFHRESFFIYRAVLSIVPTMTKSPINRNFE